MVENEERRSIYVAALRGAVRQLVLATPLLVGCSVAASAADGQVIATFSSVEGSFPEGPLVSDSLGRLYGTAASGGQFNMGSIYRLTPPAAGSSAWTMEILHSFSGPDGAGPRDGLLLDSSGNIYGTTFGGGVAGGYGVVFRLDSAPGWPVTVLHRFTGKETDAIGPNGGLVFGPGELLYGTTAAAVLSGGTEVGAVFSVSPLGDSTEYSIIYRFSTFYASSAGLSPVIGLVPGGPNKFYGATGAGGKYNLGVIYSLTQQADGSWVERAIHPFNNSGDIFDLYYQGALVRGPGATLYACGGMGGSYGLGGVISLTPPSSGDQWTETILDNFGSKVGDPTDVCGLTVQPTGSLIGTSSGGGQFGEGSLFQLMPPTVPGGAWAQTVLHSFGMTGPAGAYPDGALLREGGLYFGASSHGPGTGPQAGTGTVFSFRP